MPMIRIIENNSLKHKMNAVFAFLHPTGQIVHDKKR